jgi:hypothetical protein
MLDRCLAKQPEQRPSSITDAWDGLRKCLADVEDLQIVPMPDRSPDVYTRTVTAGSGSSMSAGIGEVDPSLTPPRPRTPPPRRRRWALAGIAVALAAGGGVALVAATAGSGGSRERVAIGSTDAAPPAPPPPTTTTTIETRVEPIIEPPAIDAGSPVDAASPPDATERSSERTSERSGERSRRRREPTPDAGTAPAPPPIRCDRPTFAEVYQAPYPTPEQVRGALNRLRTCKARGLISESDYTSIQSALVARL